MFKFVSTVLFAALAAAAEHPLLFEPNQGQADPQVQWLARGPGYYLYLTAEGATVVDHRAKSRVQMKLKAGHPLADMTGLEPTGGVSNYLTGSEPAQWRTGIPHYQRVRAPGAYDGIDMVFYGKEGQLEYDFIVQPGANPKQIRLSFDGVEAVRLDSRSGDLVLATASGGEIRHGRPKVYQECGGRKVEVMASYQLLDRHEATFQLASYDRRRALVIDPTLNWTNTIAGGAADFSSGVAEMGGNVFVAGRTDSLNFLVAAAFQLDQPLSDAFITKYSGTGKLLYSTYLGGNGIDGANAIAADATGIYVTGTTTSSNFPGTTGPQGDYDAFVTKLNANGNAIVYSRILGGASFDSATAIALAADRSVYVAGGTYSDVFPVRGAFQHRRAGGEDAFVVKLSPGGATVYSTYLGGSDNDAANGVTVDPQGYVTVVGITNSTNFPTRGAPPWHRGTDAFVTRLVPTMNDLVFSAYFGGSGDDHAADVTSDRYGFLYLTGNTASTDFLTTPGVMQTGKPSRGISGWVAKLNPYGYVFFSTYLGGAEGGEFLSSISVADDGTVAVGGKIGSRSGFPGLPSNINSTGRGFVTSMANDGARLNYTQLIGNFVAGVVLRSPAPNATYIAANVQSNGNDDVVVAKFTDLPGGK